MQFSVEKTTTGQLGFDRGHLASYLRGNSSVVGRGAVALDQIAGGYSNPTYFLTFESGESYVLRKQPPGVLLPSAHAIDREHRIISALKDSRVPVPRDDPIVWPPTAGPAPLINLSPLISPPRSAPLKWGLISECQGRFSARITQARPIMSESKSVSALVETVSRDGFVIRVYDKGVNFGRRSRGKFASRLTIFDIPMIADRVDTHQGRDISEYWCGKSSATSA